MALCPDGKFISLVTGTEPDEELREIAIHIIKEGYHDGVNVQNPFLILSALSWGTCVQLLQRMTRKDLLGLFELELENRNKTLSKDLLMHLSVGGYHLWSGLGPRLAPGNYFHSENRPTLNDSPNFFSAHLVDHGEATVTGSGRSKQASSGIITIMSDARAS